MTTKSKMLVYGQVSLEFILLNLFLLYGLYTLIPEFANKAIGIIPPIETLQLLFIFNLSWIIIILFNNRSDFYLNISFRKRLKNIVINTFFFVGVAFTLGITFKIDYFNNTTFIVSVFLFALITIINLSILRLVFAIVKRKQRKGITQKVLLVGGDEVADKKKYFQSKAKGNTYSLLGFLSNNLNGIGQNGTLGNVDDIDNVLATNEVDEVYLSLSSLDNKAVQKAIKAADYHGVRVNLIQDAPEYIDDPYGSNQPEDSRAYKLRKYPLDSFANYFVKRIFDIVFALTVLTILFPVFAVIAFLIVRDSKGGIFYKPLRMGEEGKPFKCYKFRTMSVCDDPVNGTKSTVKDDPRITKIGKFLRKRDLDELPQFINVLKGDMSVVGPRPHRVSLHNEFRQDINQYMVRHYIKPGLTGWAQVNGWRGPAITMEAKEGRVSHDIWYVQNWNLWLDIKIIFMTVFSRSARKNAF